MDDILRELASRLGIRPDQAEMGAGALLNLIRENASQLDFQQLLNSVPEAAAWMGRTPAGDGTADSGGLLGQAAGMLGSLTSSAGSLLTLLGSTGLKPETLSKFAPTFLELLQSRAGGDLVQRLARSVPVLGNLFK
ncbi:MAG TPA: DUF2780 domain-containing protein [Thermoanaerobaculia bacterium]|nr:DUF2780 domain-containing protein [Thermoanaerobaculia bacterium]